MFSHLKSPATGFQKQYCVSLLESASLDEILAEKQKNFPYFLGENNL